MAVEGSSLKCYMSCVEKEGPNSIQKRTIYFFRTAVISSQTC